MPKFLLSVFFICAVFISTAQELNCNIQVNFSQLSVPDQNLFQELQRSLIEFMNNRAWTDDKFKIDERIDCSILINLSSQQGNRFKGTVTVSSRRPVYGASYMSTVFTHQDKDFEFSYEQFENLEFVENSFESNLTATLAFYAYMILGFDYDSFSKNGGTPHFQKALSIVNNAQGAQEAGWKPFEGDNNRYWLVENHLNNRFAGLRNFAFKYYRQGLDQMHEKPNEARSAIADAIRGLNPVHNNLPNSFNMQVLFNANADEIVNVFSEGNPTEINELVNILSEINPANISKWNKMRQTR